MSLDHIILAEKYIVLLGELKHEREKLFFLVKDIPISKLDVVDRERWAVIKFINELLGELK